MYYISMRISAGKRFFAVTLHLRVFRERVYKTLTTLSNVLYYAEVIGYC